MTEHKVVLEDLPPTIRGFIRKKDGYYTIVLNARLSHEAQIECYKHELKHLEHDDLSSGLPWSWLEKIRHE